MKQYFVLLFLILSSAVFGQVTVEHPNADRSALKKDKLIITYNATTKTFEKNKEVEVFLYYGEKFKIETISANSTIKLAIVNDITKGNSVLSADKQSIEFTVNSETFSENIVVEERGTDGNMIKLTVKLHVVKKLSGAVQIEYPSDFRTGTVSTVSRLFFDSSSVSYRANKVRSVYLLEGETFKLTTLSTDTDATLEIVQDINNGISLLQANSKEAVFTVGDGPSLETIIVQEKTPTDDLITYKVNVNVSEDLINHNSNNASISNDTVAFTFAGQAKILEIMDDHVRLTDRGNNRVTADQFSGCLPYFNYGLYHTEDNFLPQDEHLYHEQTFDNCFLLETFYLNQGYFRVPHNNGNWFIVELADINGFFESVQPISPAYQSLLHGDETIIQYDRGTCFNEIVVYAPNGEEVIRLDQMALNAQGFGELSINTKDFDFGYYSIFGVVAGKETCIGFLDVEEDLSISAPPVCLDMEVGTECVGSTRSITFDVNATDDEPGFAAYIVASGETEIGFGLNDLGGGRFDLQGGLPSLPGFEDALNFDVVVKDADDQTCTASLKLEEVEESISGFVRQEWGCGPQILWADVNVTYDRGTKCPSTIDLDGMTTVDLSDPGALETLFKYDFYEVPPNQYRHIPVTNSKGVFIGGVDIDVQAFVTPYMTVQPTADSYFEGDDMVLAGQMYDAKDILIIVQGVDNSYYNDYFMYDDWDWYYWGESILERLPVGRYSVRMEYFDCFYLQTYLTEYEFEVINVAPEVSIVSPVINDVFEVGSSISLDVEASDFGGLTRFEAFYAGESYDLLSGQFGVDYIAGQESFLAVLGETEIIVEAEDGNGAVTSELIYITVNPVIIGNSDPVINDVSFSRSTVEIGEEFNVIINVTDEDDDLSFIEVSYGNQLERVLYSGNDEITITLTAEEGSAQVSVYAEDGSQMSTSRNGSIDVHNIIPVIRPILPIGSSVFVENTDVNVEVVVTDLHGIERLELLYAGISYDLLNSQNGLDVVSGLLTMPAVLGQTEIYIEAEDSYGAIATERIEIKVNPEVVANYPPVINTVIVTPNEIQIEQQFRVEVNVEDVDGDLDYVEITYAGQTAIAIGNGASLYSSFFEAVLGEEEIKVVAVDLALGESEERGTISVINESPSIEVLAPNDNASFIVGDAINVEVEARDIHSLIEFKIEYDGEVVDLLASNGGDTLVYGNAVIEASLTDDVIVVSSVDAYGVLFEMPIYINVEEEPVENNAPVINSAMVTTLAIQPLQAFEVSATIVDFNDNLDYVEFLYNGNTEVLPYVQGDYYNLSFISDVSTQNMTIRAYDTDGLMATTDVLITIENLVPDLVVNSLVVGYLVVENNTIQIEAEAYDQSTITGFRVEYDGLSYDLIGTQSGEVNVKVNESLTYVEGQNTIVFYVEDYFGSIAAQAYVVIPNAFPETIVEFVFPIVGDSVSSGTEVYFEIGSNNLILDGHLSLNGEIIDSYDPSHNFSHTSIVSGVGTQIVKFVGQDENGANIEKELEFTIVNSKPVVSIENLFNNDELIIDEAFELEFTFEDENDDIVKVEVVVGGEVIDAEMRNSVDIEPKSKGLTSIKLIAEDAAGNRAIETLVIVVIEDLDNSFSVSIHQNVENPFEFTVISDGESSLEEASVLLFDVSSPDSEYYKLDLTQSPFTYDLSELKYFPWEGTVNLGVQVEALSDEGVIGYAYNEYDIAMPVNSISKEQAAFIFEVYPNPVLNVINIVGYKGKLELITLEGDVIDVFDVKEGEQKDLSFLVDGIYYLKTTENKVVKLVKN